MTDTLTRIKTEYSDPEALRGFVTAYIADNGLTQDRAAKEIGISAAALNQWTQGKYTGNNEIVSGKLMIWLASRERREVIGEPIAAQGYTETATSVKILQVLGIVQATGDLSVIYGGAGVGKTATIRHYATMNPNVWVVTMRPDCAGVAACLEEIGEAMNVRTANRSSRLFRDICRRLESTNGLLIVDEAQHLSVPAIESVRSIHDATGIGLVLCGNESIYARLTGGSRSASFAQLFSRVGKRLRLTRTTKQDVSAIAAAYGVTSSEALSTLHAISQKPGALRGVVKTIRIALILAGKGEPLTPEHISAAWRELGGEG